ncbi:MAG: hypothetical protein E5299_01363 [Burkholderia gladioli]|nr:MAG: hypothetical protein E5299_01363 [Burkholderia gladioli]
MVAAVFLPFSTTVKGNCINRAVTPRCTGRIRWPMNGTLAWRCCALLHKSGKNRALSRSRIDSISESRLKKLGFKSAIEARQVSLLTLAA